MHLSHIFNGTCRLAVRNGPLFVWSPSEVGVREWMSSMYDVDEEKGVFLATC